ncbi:hypothetical protein [Paenirhodobacter sp. CAU 1674]|uniref:hypothetical protein n=1 Tax=Paenirhodobacter sp. CAU 1674 TaxID=3032596 RepID=UPI0023D9BC40|nr:hypothetical protein [Paenirhodobacter sp. CAU 1674]MDF2143269.1 hypothetical protein [Paenirhodobacter sp. CAU 1674]
MRGIGLTIFSGVLIGLPVAAVLAQECLVCDPEIVMTRELADCFLTQFDTTLNEMHSQNLPFALVNLGLCDGVDGGTRGSVKKSTLDASRLVFSLSEIKGATLATSTEPSKTFILDEAAIRCLDATIRSDEARFDPAGAFRPAEMCP